MLQQLFSVTSIWSIGIVLLFLFLVFQMNRLPKKKFSFARRVLIGSGCGSVFGLAVYALNRTMGQGISEDVTRWFSLISQGYIGLFRVLIAPAVLIATIRLVLHTPAYKEEPAEVKLKKRVNTLMLALAVCISLTLGILLQVGAQTAAVELGTVPVQWTEGHSIPELLGNLVPINIASDVVFGNVVAVFVVAMLIGLATRRMSGKYMDTVKPVFDLTDAAFSIFGSVCKTVIAWKPSGAFAIMAVLLAVHGPIGLWWICKFILVLFLAAVCMLILQLLFCACSGVSPARFLKAGKIPMHKAIKTCSGSACLPEAQTALSQDLGLDATVTDDVASYAIASGMQGCAAMFPTMALVFAVNMAGLTWSPDLIISAVIVIVLTSYGITGIPGTATMAEFAAVMGTGLEGVIDGVGPMIAIDPIGDVIRTLINVTGCMANAIIVERRVKK